MATRKQQCGQCMVYLQIPQHLQFFHCPACQAKNWVEPYDAPQPPPCVLPAPPAHGKKRAVLCGVSYLQTTYKLKGVADDVKRMRYLLVDKLKFPSECVLTLTGKFIHVSKPFHV